MSYYDQDERDCERDSYEEGEYPIDGVGFADPGGNSALRAATKNNPRNLPCPTCGRKNVLTPIDGAQPKGIMTTTKNDNQAAERHATIIEAGNGLPGVGSLVYDSTGNTVYEIIATDGRISTNGPGVGNSIEATLREADESDPTGYTDEEWEQVSDCRVDLDDLD